MGRGGQLLPSVAEMTTGVSPYNTPAYAYPMGPGGPGGGRGGGYPSPGLMLPAIGMIGVGGGGRGDGNGYGKRRGSPESGLGPRETSRRRQ